MRSLSDLQTKFRARFGSAPRIYRAPGRVNLIGEHTDYNNGFVMPAAIHLSCWVAAALRRDRRVVIYSENVDQSAEADLARLPIAPSGNWSDYPIGVAVMLAQAGYALPGVDLYIRGEVPLGAGLGSSAAIEVSVAYAFIDSMRESVDRTRLALLCQRAENEFVGARCGIMDQFIACHAQSGTALFLDCRSLDFRLLHVPEVARIVICNTMVKHEIAGGEYNARRGQCEDAVRRLQQAVPDAKSLRDVDSLQFEHSKELLPDVIYRRARHVITENQRVLDAAAALEAGDMARFGTLMVASHASLRDDYEVTCPELDLMVDIARQQEGVWGARMTGGGFGGCTVNLVRAADTADFQQRVAKAYLAATGITPRIYVSDASAGAETVAE